MKISRRKLLSSTALAAGSLSLTACADKMGLVHPVPGTMLSKAIPSSGEQLPVIGLGTLQAFDVDVGAAEQAALSSVLSTLSQHNGTLIDSSPRYGKAESVVGELCQQQKLTDILFFATKVFSEGKQVGIDEMNASLERLQTSQIDLMQVHSMRDWKNHIPSIREFQQDGKVRYIGITTHRDPSHEQMVSLMRKEKLDFIQVNYNLIARAAEKEIFPLAQELGIAVMVNVPFAKAELFKMTEGVALPEWASEFDCQSWAQFFLKYTISHPAVTCVIPRTSKPKHMLDNVQAGFGVLPDQATRIKMTQLIENL